MKSLVTGGAGFIGSHLVPALLMRGHDVRVLDALIPQVHGEDCDPTSRVPVGAEFVHGDVRDLDVWRRALAGCDAVVHLAAEVGVGQSMYDIVRYVSTNCIGTANLLQVIAERNHNLRRLVVASSMSTYGEGAYLCPQCGPVAASIRPLAQLERRHWEPLCRNCQAELSPLPTAEDKTLQPTSVYAISKRDQEEMCMVVGRAYGVPTVALRFFNIYGPGQSLSNPYTGVAAIFASRLLNGKPPLVFEDGKQSRDFVHISDVVQGLLLALERDEATDQVFNIGSGVARTVNDLALALAAALGVPVAPEVVGKFREGDIRHCYADISKAQRLLGYAPAVAFEEGLVALMEWVRTQTSEDLVGRAAAELASRGLTK